MVTKVKPTEEILSRFNQWAEERKSELRDIPAFSVEHSMSLRARISLLQSAKHNLSRIVREVNNVS